MNIIKNRYWYFLISLVVIVPGIIALMVWGFPLSIDFTGGSSLEVQFEQGKALPLEQVRSMYDKAGDPDAIVQSSGNDVLIIRSKAIDETTKNDLVSEMGTASGGQVTVLSFDTVGPSVSQEVASRAAEAVALAALGILIYITFAFHKVTNAFRYGTAAIIAMLHDVLVVVGMEAIFGHFLHWEVDSLFLTALLTVIGFSVHDTVVVFDRIRENAQKYRRLPYTKVVNHSIVQTLARSIDTQLTVMLTLLALALFGGDTIRHFVTILLVGVFSGTYSSIFNASPILVVWENKEWRTWFRRNQVANA